MSENNRIILLSPSANTHRNSEENLGLSYLAAVLRSQNYYVKIIDAWLKDFSIEEVVDMVNNFCPNIIGISCYRSNLRNVQLLVENIREIFPGIPIIYGGYGPTFYDTDFLFSDNDIVVRGEAELITVPLLDCLLHSKDKSEIPCLTWRAGQNICRTDFIPVVCNLDGLPFAQRDDINFVMSQKNPVHVCTSRGCSGHCIYCSVSAFHRLPRGAPIWRGRSINNIIAEFEQLYYEYGARVFKIVDDSFLDGNRNLSWCEEFEKRLFSSGMNIRFRTQVRADRLSESIVHILKKTGWFATSIGIENFSVTALSRMGKKASLRANLDSLSWLRDSSIITQVGLILFDPWTTVEELETNYSFLSNNRWIIVKGIFSEMFAARGTVFTDRLKEKGVLEDDNSMNYNYPILDFDARRVYNMLKRWYLAYNKLHDKVTDPLNAPRVISFTGYQKISFLCQQLMCLDLNFFRLILDRVKSGFTNTLTDADFVENQILLAFNDYAKIEREINEIYEQEGLVFNVSTNQFIHN